MIWAAMTVAFFGFMRLGELTCNSKFSFETHLSPSDARLLPSLSQPDYLSILTKNALTYETRSLLAMSGVNPMQYAGHRYRIGANATAASVGLPPLVN